jgi:hypothetical protein
MDGQNTNRKDVSGCGCHNRHRNHGEDCSNHTFKDKQEQIDHLKECRQRIQEKLEKIDQELKEFE